MTGVMARVTPNSFHRTRQGDVYKVRIRFYPVYSPKGSKNRYYIECASSYHSAHCRPYMSWARFSIHRSGGNGVIRSSKHVSATFRGRIQVDSCESWGGMRLQDPQNSLRGVRVPRHVCPTTSLMNISQNNIYCSFAYCNCICRTVTTLSQTFKPFQVRVRCVLHHQR